MKKFTLKNKLTKKFLSTLGIIILFIICALFLWEGISNSKQSEMPLIAGVHFSGEYKIEDGEWCEIKKGEHISASQGDVTLRGYFQMLNPETGEPISNLTAGKLVSLYFEHINVQILLDDGKKITLDAENEILGEDACAIMRGSYTVQSADKMVYFLIHNPHRFGNENAIDNFLNKMSLAPGIILDKMDSEEGKHDRMAGMLILLTSIIIIGIALFSSIIKIPYNNEIWRIGFMSLFAGIYILFDSEAIYIWNDSFILNTRLLGISMMMYMLFCKALITFIVKGKYKKLAKSVVFVSGFLIALCIFLSFSKKIKFYDTWMYWAMCEILLSIILIVCALFSIKKESIFNKILFGVGLMALAAFAADAIATALGAWSGGFLSKYVFIVIFIGMLVVILRIVPSHIKAAIKAKELEAEQQALKLELQESKISIMLSQMQPHFIFNTLNTIYHLCEIDPDVARSTISSFSEYLRNNIDTLGQSEMIFFEKELSFVKTYLDIEKVRFDDELEISFDIGVTDFKLPVLTIQPLVENAVKHGTSKKKGVANLFISTSENADFYEICIRDTGVGFDTETYNNDGHKHIGISNVRQRLKNLCGGTLLIHSELGVGTSAIVRIPKKEQTDYENNCGR